MQALRPPESLDQVVFHRVAGSGSVRGDLDVAVDGGQVIVDGARADDELLGDVRIGESLRQQSQHVDLAGGQSIWGGGCWFHGRR